MNPETPAEAELPRFLVALLATTAGVSVAALYYAQPLLVSIARLLHVGSSAAGYLVTASQIGYVVGLAFIVPLGDLVERRKLLCLMLAAAAVVSFAAGLAPSFAMLAVILTVTGMSAASAQVVVPLAASLAATHARGRVTGTVMSGLLVGILLARTVAGLIASATGWRSVFIAAALVELVLVLLLRIALPKMPAPHTLTYPRLLASVWQLVKNEPVLRGRMVLGATSMACFSLMWTCATLMLVEHYHYSPAVIGLFGLAGVAGALGAPLMGRLADAGRGALGTTIAWVCLIVSWGALDLGAHHLWMFILGLLVFDFGAQSAQLSNQARIYALDPAARSRLTTAYMVAFFLGGAAGSAIATTAYSHGGWSFTCLVGAAGSVVGLIVWLTLHSTVEARAAR